MDCFGAMICASYADFSANTFSNPDTLYACNLERPKPLRDGPGPQFADVCRTRKSTNRSIFRGIY